MTGRDAPCRLILTIRGQWRRATPETAAETGAVGYLFARRLRETLDIPVGIVNALGFPLLPFRTELAE